MYWGSCCRGPVPPTPCSPGPPHVYHPLNQTRLITSDTMFTRASTRLPSPEPNKIISLRHRVHQGLHTFTIPRTKQDYYPPTPCSPGPPHVYHPLNQTRLLASDTVFNRASTRLPFPEPNKIISLRHHVHQGLHTFTIP